MKKLLLFALICLAGTMMFAQSINPTPWELDNTGTEALPCNIYFQLYIDGEYVENPTNFYVVAFDQNEICRMDPKVGYARWLPSTYQYYYYNLTCRGYVGCEYHFRIWDTNTNSERTDLVLDLTSPVYNYDYEVFTWSAQGKYGSATNPIHLNFATIPYSIDITGYGENAGGYYLIASPVTDPITPSAENGFLTSAYDLYYFDQNGDGEGNEWFNYEADPFTIQSKKGYLYASQTDTQLQFAGTACTDGNVQLEYSTTNPSNFIHGWNLIGNPLAEDATIDRACYVMNGDGTELTPADEGALIPAMHGVFVKATTSGESVTFTPGTTPNGGAKIDINVLKDRGATIDRAIVRLGEGGTLPKFQLNPENTKIFIHQNGDDYAVVSSNENEIPVSFKAASNGTYTLNVAPQNTEMEYLHLIDNMTGANIDLLANPNYTFEANTGDYASRFTLVLSNTTGLVEHFAFYNGHNWTISNDGEALIQVVDVMGRILNSKEICGNAEINISQPAGVYMFRLVNGSDVKVQKVVVR
jgi:hypothetical protein